MTSAAELAVLRKQTKSFIDENPTIITVSRRATRESDGAGGFTSTDPDPVDPQTFRKIIQSKAQAQENIDSDRAKPEFVLIGEYTADIQSGDTFTFNLIKYRVEYVRDDRRYETWAEVVLDG